MPSMVLVVWASLPSTLGQQVTCISVTPFLLACPHGKHGFVPLHVPSSVVQPTVGNPIP